MELLWIILLLGSLGLLVFSSDIFVDKAERVGLSLGISSFIVGVTVVAMGTSLPELIAGVLSVQRSLSQGDPTLQVLPLDMVIGSNIANILIVIGIASLWVKKIKVKSPLIESDIPLLVMFTGVFVIFSLSDTMFSRPEAFVSLGLFMVFLLYTIKTRNKHAMFTMNKPDFERKNLIILVAALIGVIAGGQLVLISLERIIDIWALTQLGIVTVILLGLSTSLPEIIVSVQAVRTKRFEVAMGNVFGSNIFNILLVAGVSGTIAPLPLSAQALSIGIPFLILATVVFVFASQDNRIGRWEGIGFLCLYVVFLLMMTGII